MNHFPVLLLYGIDEQTLPVDAEVTRDMIHEAEEALGSRGWQIATSEVVDDLKAALAAFAPEEWVVFNLCEGGPGQAFYYARAAEELERRGYVYTGSGPVSLHETQFKPKMKRMLERGQVPTPPWAEVEQAHELEFEAFPAIIKPAGEHCSFGITRESVVLTLAEARAQAASIIRQYPGGAMIEQFLDSEEYAVSLWGEDNALEVIGISMIQYDAFADVRDRLCTFEAKWTPGTEAYEKTMPTCPAPLSPQMQRELETLARCAHVSCGVRDYSRIDIRLKAGRPGVLDVNGNCAMSENSGFPSTARIAGYDYGSVLEHLILMAARRRKAPGAMMQISNSHGSTSIAVHS